MADEGQQLRREERLARGDRVVVQHEPPERLAGECPMKRLPRHSGMRSPVWNASPLGAMEVGVQVVSGST